MQPINFWEIEQGMYLQIGYTNDNEDVEKESFKVSVIVGAVVERNLNVCKIHFKESLIDTDLRKAVLTDTNRIFFEVFAGKVMEVGRRVVSIQKLSQSEALIYEL